MPVKKQLTCQEIAEKTVKDRFAYQSSFELEMALRAVKATAPKVILEIGVAHGASLAAWIEACKPELAIGMDPLTIPKTPEQQKSFDGLVKEFDIKMIPWISRLEIAHEMLVKLLDGRKIDFLFIDGGHSYEDARHDFQEYLKYMAPNGIVGFHDIYGNDTLADAGSLVNFFWERMKKNYLAYDEFHYHSSMGIGIIYLNSKILLRK